LTHRAKPRNRLRIIGGRWRRRTIVFPAHRNLRPTPDRVRETLFNWLQNHIPGSCCLDLFAGSGALGLEALSRGARHVDFVEQSRPVAEALAANLKQLSPSHARVWPIAAGQFLRQANQSYDIVFLDPPYDSPALTETLQFLASRPLLASPAWLYVESRRGRTLPPIPRTWHRHRHCIAGDVRAELYRVSPETPETDLDPI